MRLRSLLLCGIWACLALLAASPTVRSDPPPDCEECGCHEAQAWQTINYDSNGIPSFGTPSVLRVYDELNPKVLGAVTPDARWKTVVPNVTDRRVYAPTCLADMHQEDVTKFHKLDYNETWPSLCKATGTQTKESYRPVKYDAQSTNYAIRKNTVTRYTCGPKSVP